MSFKRFGPAPNEYATSTATFVSYILYSIEGGRTVVRDMIVEPSIVRECVMTAIRPSSIPIPAPRAQRLT
jgi:hypothetical protein